MKSRRDHLNILYSGTLPPHHGGSAISSSLLLEGFARLGHTVRAVAPLTPETQASGDRYAASHPEIQVSRFLVPRFDITPLLPADKNYRRQERQGARAGLERFIAEARPDVLFVGRESFAPYAVEVAQAHGLPCLLRVAGSSTTAILNRAYPDDLIEEYLSAFRKADRIVSPAHHMAEGLRHLGLDRVEVVLNAVSLRRFAPRPKDEALLRQLDIPPGSVVVMHVAALKDVKRPMDLVKAAPRLLAQHPLLAFVIVGDGPLRAELAGAAQALGVAAHFRFTGWRDYDEIPDLLNLADLVVMPSESEGLARVYLETMASGRTLVASDIPAAREVVQDGRCGLLFKKGDIGDLTATVLRATASADLRASLGRAAREQSQHYSLDRAVADYLAAFEEIRNGRVERPSLRENA
jgi:glycosyltransferase involved in cell wall biosynthesis